MLNAFKLKPFDLEPIYAEWKDGPVFAGNPKKDLPVEEWLEKIREGCVERGVPEEYWYKVAQHFMGPKARARLDELKQVIVKVHGGKYRWTWKKFKVAMMNMGWTIDKDAKETIKVQGRGSGLWFMRKKDTDSSSIKDDGVEEISTIKKGGESLGRKGTVESNKKPTELAAKAGESTKNTNRQDDQPTKKPSRSNSIWITKQPIVEEPEELPLEPPRPRPTRSATVSGFWPGKMATDNKSDHPQRPGHQKAGSDGAIMTTKKNTKSSAPSRSHTEVSGEEVTTTTEAPAWLLNACTALEYITSEHPKAMSIISAILITAGSIPAIPAIAAGAGGAVLASGAAHAIGAIAVGVGQALNAGVQHQQKKQQGGTSGAHISDGH